ncbi:LPP20 family lipoprotein [Marinomonas ostreistagni]|nr:LPP20 family lipoprotein [Marinomonas ostreistagni]
MMQAQPQAQQRKVTRETEVIDVMPREPIVVRTTGYSAPMTNSSFSPAQRRLMTMRGSKLDAYRNLAERVYGIDISSNNSVSNMVAQHDEIRAYVDAYLVGAKVVSQRELADGTFETVVELALKENFRQCVSSVAAMRSDPNCLMNNNYSTSASVPKPERPSSFYSVQ